MKSTATKMEFFFKKSEKPVMQSGKKQPETDFGTILYNGIDAKMHKKIGLICFCNARYS